MCQEGQPSLNTFAKTDMQICPSYTIQSWLAKLTTTTGAVDTEAAAGNCATVS